MTLNYMTLNAEIRFRYGNTDQKNFAIAPSVTPGTALKGPVLTNFYDFAPSLSVRPFPTVSAALYYSFPWRYSGRRRAIPARHGRARTGQNSYATTVLAPGRTIGRQSDLRISWEITPHFLMLNEFGVFDPGSPIRAADGRTAMYLVKS